MSQVQDQTKLATEIDSLLKRVVTQLEKCQEMLDQARYRLPNAGDGAAADQSKATDDLLHRIVRPVYVMTVVEKANGTSKLILDDDPPIPLTRRLTKLLLWIVKDHGPDGLPRYKSMDETIKVLRVPKKHTLNQQIYRLRQLLQEHRRNQFLVDTCNSSIRFLVREVIVRRAKTPK